MQCIRGHDRNIITLKVNRLTALLTLQTKEKKISKWYRAQKDHDFFTFDAFVGYSRSDSNWVITQLLPRLELECNLRLCIHERDWLPGRDIAENILESIDNSRKTLLIVSNAFALSPWCHFELTMAQTRLMEEDRDSLVLILLEEIADCNLTPRLQIQMQRRTYIEWTKQSNVGQQLFWANLKHALDKPSHSLMNESLSISLLK